MSLELKIARIKRGLQQQETAKAVGISTQYLNALENGRANNPSISVMRKISEVLETPLQDLFFNE